VTHQEKINFMLEDLGREGVARRELALLLYRLLWLFGFETPPPLFQNFLGLFLRTTVLGLLLYGLVTLVFYIFVNSIFQAMTEDPGAKIWITTALLGSLSIGLAVAISARHRRRRLGLPSWADYEEAMERCVRPELTD
jgi:hypothetical protein